MSFASLGLSAPILKAIEEKGYTEPSPIQAKAVPAVLTGKDVMAAAQTGTGKTAGFTLPILELLSKGKSARTNQARTLILTPTRELAAQIAENVETYSAHLKIKSTVVFGGVKINPQMMRLRQGVDILVATPGRLLDLYNQNAVKFDQLEVLVLDEADRMLDMGFLRDIKKILALLPKSRQNLLFSATFSPDIRELAKGLVNSPVEISVTPPNSTAERVEQLVYSVDKKQKTPLLIKLIKENNWKQVLVFMKTKHTANKLTRQLEAAGINAAAIHGNKSQGARTKALANFKSGEVNVLVATDIAARGIDISQLPQVVNFDLPNVSEDYVHRIGRTGRAGAAGQAYSLVCADEIDLLNDVQHVIQTHIPREIVAGFEPVHELPENRKLRPIKAKKPKKPKKPNSSNDRAEHKDGQRSGDVARGHKPPNKNKRHIPRKKSTGANKPSGSGNNQTKRSDGNKSTESANNKPRRAPRRRTNNTSN